MENENNNLLSGYDATFIDEQLSTRISDGDAMVFGAAPISAMCQEICQDEGEDAWGVGDIACTLDGAVCLVYCSSDCSSYNPAACYWWAGMQVYSLGYKGSTEDWYAVSDMPAVSIYADFLTGAGVSQFGSGRTTASTSFYQWYSGYTTNNSMQLPNAGTKSLQFTAKGLRWRDTSNILRARTYTGTSISVARKPTSYTTPTSAFVGEKIFKIDVGGEGMEHAYYSVSVGTPFNRKYLLGKYPLILYTSAMTNTISATAIRDGSLEMSVQGVTSLSFPVETGNKLLTLNDCFSYDAGGYSTDVMTAGTEIYRVVTMNDDAFVTDSFASNHFCKKRSEFRYGNRTANYFYHEQFLKGKQTMQISGPSQQWVYCNGTDTIWTAEDGGYYYGFSQTFLTWDGSLPTNFVSAVITIPSSLSIHGDLDYDDGYIDVKVYLVVKQGSGTPTQNTIVMKKLIASGRLSSTSDTYLTTTDHLELGMSESRGGYKLGCLAEWEVHRTNAHTRYAAIYIPSFTLTMDYKSNE